MVGHQQWSAGLAYVDLFGGPGICESEETGKRIPGSALIAAHARKPFSKILVSEMNPTFARALETRLRATPASENTQVFTGDCNVCAKEIVQHIPRRALTLPFVDPENLNVDFSTVEKLAMCGQVDLLILFADRMDLVRNVDLYEKQPESVLDRMMGPHSKWRERWANLSNRSAENICRLFVNEYQHQLTSHLGYVPGKGDTGRQRTDLPAHLCFQESKRDRVLG